MEHEKKIGIEHHVKSIMELLGLDLTDDSLKDTPRRVAKMFVDQIFSGLNEENYPKITVVDNKFLYDQMLIETGIEVMSICEHHLLPIIGSAHIAYIPKRRVLGLSKFNRIVRFFSKRPQIQERLTEQVKNELQTILETEDVAVVIDAIHLCVRMRGVEDTHTVTRTTSLGGVFKTNAQSRSEFLIAIPKSGELRL